MFNLPQVSWVINNEEVFPDNRLRFVTSDVDTAFHNSCAKRSDTGSYTIQLVNSEGSDSATCRVSNIIKYYINLNLVVLLSSRFNLYRLNAGDYST